MATQEQGQKGGVGAEIDRRREPRPDVSERIAGQIRPGNVPMTLLNVSLGGCLMQAPVAYAAGQTLELNVAVAERDPIVIRARVLHTMRTTAGEVTAYVCGLQFLDRGSPLCDDALKSLFGLLR